MIFPGPGIGGYCLPKDGGLVGIETIDTALWDEETLTRLREAVATLRDRLSARFPEENAGPSTDLA